MMLLHRDRDDAPVDTGGVAARRAIVRWSCRLFRRQWRQQVLVLALLAVTIAAAVCVTTIGFNLSPASARAEFGSANHFLRIDDPDPQVLANAVSASEEWFGTIDVIGHRPVAVPGAAEPLDYRSQQPDGPYAGPLLDLRDGRLPTAEGEVAVTDGVTDLLDVAIGTTLDLDGTSRAVVGVVENPSDLADEFVLVDAATASPQSVKILIDDDRDHVNTFRMPDASMVEISSTEAAAEDVTAAMSVLLLTVMALAMVALIATASFVVIAQRRLRQLGILGAIGASERQLRLVLVAGGAVTGVAAAILGVICGVAGWLAMVPWLERTAGHRIDAWNFPWWAVGVAAVMGIAAATVASWWPARVMARVPPVTALSGRPPSPAPVHRSAALAAGLVVGGLVTLAWVGGISDGESVPWTDLLLICAGTVAAVLGALLLSPLAIRAAARSAAGFPLAPRLALRDLGRNQSRSSAALAAISLAIGIPVAIVVTAASAEHAASAGNLSDRQMLVRIADIDGPFAPGTEERERFDASVGRLAATLDDARVTSLDVALDPEAELVENTDRREVVALGERDGDGWRDVTNVYVATPELLDGYGVDVDEIGSDIDMLTVETGELRILGVALAPGEDRSDPEQVVRRMALTPSYSSLPGTLITPQRLAERGWEATPSGRWLIETSDGISADQRERARDIAASSGLTVETRDRQGGLAATRSVATMIGIVLALGILAMTVGLIREEAAGDVRTLTATGAASTTRRALTSATAGALATLGVVLGTAGAYAALAAGHVGALDDLSRVPALQLGLIVVATPIVAACGGWIFAGREPPAIARRPID